MVIVVEGKNDANKIKSVFKNASVITTNGSEVSNDTINLIKKLSMNNEIVLCLDPDGPGERIRKMIVDNVPSSSHVFAKRELAISKNKKKVGIEHMSKEDIVKLFEHINIVKEGSDIDIKSFYKMGYMESKSKREILCRKLEISYCNAKQLYKRLRMFGITKKELEEYDS